MRPIEVFAQLRLKFTDPIQYHYEVIRPIMLYAQTISERSRETGVERTQVGEKAKRFIQQGMLGLVDQRLDNPGRERHQYPDPIAEYILSLKLLYPPIHYREIVRIIKRIFGYHTNHHTVKQFLDRHPISIQLEFDLPYYHDFKDAYQARWWIVKFYYEGWNKKSIAGLFKLSHQHVGRLIAIFEYEGFAGLEDKRSRPLNHAHNQLTLPFLKDVLEVQKEYPRAGEFRVHGILEKQSEEPVPSQRTVSRAMAINREFHGAPGSWVTNKKAIDPETEPKYLPFRPQYRQQLWYIDIRYLVKLDDRWVYSICVIEGYSRKILAGMASEYQDLASILQILYAALSRYGSPVALVSDNAAVFTSPQIQYILTQLQIEPKFIEKGKPWQNLIEAQFKIQLRIADYKFETAPSFDQIQARHADFVETFNTTAHYAHTTRDDGRKTPAAVLDWVRGRAVDPERLHALFQSVRFERTVNRFGFVSIQRFYLYAERGLSRKRVSIWIYQGKLHLEYQQTMLAKYSCDFEPHQQQLQNLTQPTLFDTDFKSPQLVLFELDDDQWLKIRHRTYHRRQKRVAILGQQLTLLHLDSVA